MTVSTKKSTSVKSRVAAKAKPKAKPKATPKPKPKAKPKAATKVKLRPPIWELRLYVSGRTPRSRAAFVHINRICEEYLAGHYRLTVIDIRKHPTLARDEQIVAVPTLIRLLPAPLQRLIGDLSQIDRVLFGLDLKPLEVGRA